MREWFTTPNTLIDDEIPFHPSPRKRNAVGAQIVFHRYVWSPLGFPLGLDLVPDIVVSGVGEALTPNAVQRWFFGFFPALVRSVFTLPTKIVDGMGGPPMLPTQLEKINEGLDVANVAEGAGPLLVVEISNRHARSEYGRHDLEK